MVCLCKQPPSLLWHFHSEYSKVPSLQVAIRCQPFVKSSIPWHCSTEMLLNECCLSNSINNWEDLRQPYLPWYLMHVMCHEMNPKDASDCLPCEDSDEDNQGIICTCKVYSLRSLFRRGAIVPCQLWLAVADTAISKSVPIRWLRCVCTILCGKVSLKTGAAPEGGTFCKHRFNLSCQNQRVI